MVISRAVLFWYTQDGLHLKDAADLKNVTCARCPDPDGGKALGAARPARGTTATADDRLRDVLSALVRAAGLVRRIGVNRNQAVARLNATGQRSADLLPYAAESIRRSERLDTIADQVRNALR
jgi:hypothetical protein